MNSIISVIHSWNTLQDSVTKLERELLSDLRNPNTSGDVRTSLAESYKEVFAHLENLKEDLNKEYPRTRFHVWPWNKEAL